MSQAFLELQNVKKHFPIRKGFIFSKIVAQVKSVDGISFVVNRGDTFGIVGESGCGKTTTSKLILLLEKLTSGSIFFRGENISELSGEKLRRYRASVKAMFQDPYGSLNPRMRIGDIIGEPIEVNLKLSKKEINDRVKQLLVEVGLYSHSAELYPHEFSGGQRQRIALARAIAINPSLVILDEPVSALDVSVQAQLMNLLMDIKQKEELTYIVIAHNLAVVRHMCNRIAVMYLGKIVEYGSSEEVYEKRLHPYTKALLLSALPLSSDVDESEVLLSDEVPSPLNLYPGCRFHPRCPYSKDICSRVEPSLENASSDHYVACHLWKEIS